MNIWVVTYYALVAQWAPIIFNGQHAQSLAIEPAVVSRQKQIDGLLDIAKNTVHVQRYYGLAAVSIRKLGAIRANEATPFLIENLTFYGLGPLGSTDHIPSLEEVCPSVYALAQIGLPAFPPLLTKVDSTDAEITHFYAAMVFYEAMGYDDARAYLGTKVDRQENRDKKQRLRSLLKQLDEVHAKR